ncbi:unnamed protein product [Rodentolepis nana]|uniref:Reverse transcriptase domain-containing protein n=1 Tax=Rodentolepis nana TaxID=102285 RepID=A0A0R3THF6_RODNA|nr:unnamed protein product [Rodentolepis nana]
MINTFVRKTSSDLKIQVGQLGEIKEDVIPNNVLTEPYRPCELNAAIKQLKCKKSPGEDGILPDFLIRMEAIAKETMLPLLNKIWESSLLPNQWKVAIVIPILKKGKDPSNFDNYRPFSLTSVPAKLMERMVNRGLTWLLETNNILRSEQAGFRPRRSTNQQVLTLSQHNNDVLD